MKAATLGTVIPMRTPRRTAGVLLKDFETWMRAWGASDTTVRSRSSVVGVWLAACGGNPYTAPAAAVMAWLASPAFSPWTRQTYFYHLKSFYTFMEDCGLVVENPMRLLRTPRTPKDRPRPLTTDEAARALAASKGNLRTWLLLGLLAGLRAHEIAKVRGQDVNERSLYVVGKGMQQAFIPTHPTLWQVAQSYPALGYWFPSRKGSKTPHIAGTSVSAIVTRHFRSLGIEGSSHRCRHSYATNLLRNGANIRVVQTLMRHESLATTAKYTAVDEDERALAIGGLVA